MAREPLPLRDDTKRSDEKYASGVWHKRGHFTGHPARSGELAKRRKNTRV
jgi:hypothetical protein